MVVGQPTLSGARRSTLRQRSIRRRSAGLSLKLAVRAAVDALFRFKYRAAKANALWSESERVWLGAETFFYWSLWDADIDIPWVVATAAGAPADANDLREAVRTELTSYWTERTARLPPKERPRWLPLP